MNSVLGEAAQHQNRWRRMDQLLVCCGACKTSKRSGHYCRIEKEHSEPSWNQLIVPIHSSTPAFTPIRVYERWSAADEEQLDKAIELHGLDVTKLHLYISSKTEAQIRGKLKRKRTKNVDPVK